MLAMTIDEYLDGDPFEEICCLGGKIGVVYGLAKNADKVGVYRFSEHLTPNFRYLVITQKEYIEIVSTLHETLPFTTFVRQVNERMA